MRAKTVGWLVAAVAALLAGMLSVTPAAAGAAAPYPPSACGQLAISTTTPNPGQTVTLSGVGFRGNAHLTLVLHPGPTVLGHPTTDGQGSFSTSVRIPGGTSGRYSITATGTNVSSCPVDPVSLTVGAAAANGGGSGPDGSGLAFTGLDVLLLVLLGIGLVALGIAAARGGRRRTATGH